MLITVLDTINAPELIPVYPSYPVNYGTPMLIKHTRKAFNAVKKALDWRRRAVDDVIQIKLKT